jgi:hypothetical protein
MFSLGTTGLSACWQHVEMTETDRHATTSARFVQALSFSAAYEKEDAPFFGPIGHNMEHHDTIRAGMTQHQRVPRNTPANAKNAGQHVLSGP